MLRVIKMRQHNDHGQNKPEWFHDTNDDKGICTNAMEQQPNETREKAHADARIKIFC